LVRGTWGDDAVSPIYQVWVRDHVKANQECPRPNVTSIAISPSGVHIAEGTGILLPDRRIIYPDGTIRVLDQNYVILPGGTIVFPSGQTVLPPPRLEPVVVNVQTEDEEPQVADSSIMPEPVIPKWIKSNADWWERGLISDLDFATGIAYLVKEDIIHVENVEVDPQGEIVIDENITIPTWIHNNAAWWVSGSISDLDFLSGIQYMVTEEIISFDARALVDKEYVDEFAEFIPQLTEQYYLINKWNELAISWLLEIKNVESDIIEDQTKQTWNEYSDNRNQETMNHAISLEESSKEAADHVLQVADHLKDVKQNEENIKNFAKQNNVHILDLEKAAKIPQDKLDEVTKPKTNSEINESYDKVENALEQAKNESENTFQKFEMVFVEKDVTKLKYNFWIDKYEANINAQFLTDYEEIFVASGYTEFRALLTMPDSPPDTTCSEGYVLENGECTIDTTCSEGYVLENGECTLDTLEPPPDPEESENEITKYVDDLEFGAWSSTYEDGKVKTLFWVAFYVKDYATNHFNDYFDTKVKILNNQGQVVYETVVTHHTIGGTNFPDIEVDPSDGPFTVRIEDTGSGELQPRILPGVSILFKIAVLNIGGEQYPITQFTTWKWQGECDDAWHYHTNSGHAINLNLLGLPDPDPEECGYGKVSDIDISFVHWNREQVDAFKDLFGINPVGSEAMLGGEGP